jgi:hypothetical protein
VLRRWKVNALLLLREYLEVVPKGHPFGVAMQKGWNLWRGGAVSPHELFFLVFPRPSEYQI